MEQDVNLSLAPGSVPGYLNLYRRSNCGAEGYEALTTVEPPSWEAEPVKYFPRLVGLSGDGAHAIFAANDGLEVASPPEANPGAPGEGSNFQLYEPTPAGMRLVSVLGNKSTKAGGPATANSIVGASNASTDGLITEEDSLHHAVSTDGSRVYWSTLKKVGEQMVPVLYLRVNPDQEQSEVKSKACTEAQKACTFEVSELASANAAARFWDASADGSAALFGVAAAGGEDLYEFDAEEDAVHKLAGKVMGVMGASEDLSRIYFVSREDLDGAGPAQEGGANLYLYEAGAGIRFLARLSEDDGVAAGLTVYPSLDNVNPKRRSSRVSPDGLTAAFMSNSAALASEVAGYDNTDAHSPRGKPERRGLPLRRDRKRRRRRARLRLLQPDRLAPRRAPTSTPAPMSSTPPPPCPAGKPSGSPRACSPQTASACSSRAMTRWPSATPTACATSISGRPRETATAPPPTPHTTPKTAAACASISSGKSPQGAEFIDASADGSDAYFFTQASLVPQDPGLIDAYDARIGGGFASAGAEEAAECEGQACQGSAAAPASPTPASAAPVGEGNLEEKPPARRPCPKGKRRVRRGGKARCVRKPHRHRKRHHRHGHKRRHGRAAR